jgi:hypothetical protein
MRVEGKAATTASMAQAAARSPSGALRFVLPELAAKQVSVAVARFARVGGLDTLIALQAHGDAKERKKRAVKRGYDLLDALDALKVALLSGQVSTASLQRLATSLKGERMAGDDPKLDELIAHIELRAQVEIAKRDPR